MVPNEKNGNGAKYGGGDSSGAFALISWRKWTRRSMTRLRKDELENRRNAHRQALA